MKKITSKQLLLLVFSFVFANVFAQQQVVYLEHLFENDSELESWSINEDLGTISIVDNVDGTGKVLKLESTAPDFNNQTTMSRGLTFATPNDEEYFLEYDYRTESIDTKFDNWQLNPGPARLQLSLRGDNGVFWIHDNSNARSEAPAGTIQPNTWHNIKVRINASTNTVQLEIDGTQYPEFISDQDLTGLSSILLKVLNGNTFYVDNLRVYTFGRPLPEPTVLPTVPSDHPRVFVRPNTLDALKDRFNSPTMANYKQLLEQEAASQTTGTLGNGRVVTAKYRSMESSAFLYLVNDDTAAGNKAKNMLLENFSSMEQTSPNQDREIHRSVLTAAMVYDWCYDLFTPAERTAIIEDVIRLVKLTEYSFPLVEQNYLVNHFGEEKVPDLLAFGIACFNEDPSIYNNVATELYEGLIPSRNFIYEGKKHHQGSSYGPSRYESEMYTTFIMTRMGVERPYSDNQQFVPFETLYKRRPDGILMTEDDDFNYDLTAPTYFGIHGAFMAAQVFQDPYIQDEALRYEDFINEFTFLKDATLMMLFKDEKLQPKSINELPLSTYFGSPYGQTIARTGWDVEGGKNSGSAIATMNLGEYYFGNHDHLDAGHFSIYYKGPLAIDSGALSNSTNNAKFGGRSQHWFYYYQESLAHNTLAVRDPNEPDRSNGNFPEINQNEGGQISKINSNKIKFSFEDIENGGKQAEILAQGMGPDLTTPDYTYLKGDIANAYDFPGRAPKVEEAKRSFVFLNLKNSEHPAALVVFDKVKAAEANFEKRWLLHSIQEPSVNETVTVIDNTTDGYNGRLVNHTMLPKIDDLNIKTIGGEGKEFFSEDTQTNYSLASESEVNAHEAGRWRIEVSPKAEKQTDHFLNVLQVMDANGGDYLAVEEVSTNETYGIKIADRVVIFNKSGEKDNSSRFVSLPESTETVKYLITDVAAGSYDISGPQNFIGVMATEEAGVLYFEGPAGEYSIVPTGATADLDNDGILDNVDNCPTIANPDQADSDGDGIGDVCEDSDEDGVFDAVDNCIDIPNPSQVDTDGDGIGDTCEDTDNDGILDPEDICPTVANPDQADADGDGIGDVCEDADGDGVFDTTDNCINIQNADQADADGDGIGDVCEDSDGDGVLDPQDECDDTRAGVVVDAVGCEVFLLDQDNFKVEVINPSCRGNENGAIGVEVKNTTFTYGISVTDQEGITETFALDPATSTKWTKENLKDGNFEVCITVDGEANFEQCYELNVKQPEPLTAFSEVALAQKQLKLSLDGADRYYVNVNDKTFEVTGNSFTANLKAGVNSVSVSTDHDCQGKFNKEIFISEEATLSPNPTNGPVSIFVGGEDEKVVVTVHSLSGRVISEQEINIPASRNTKLDLTNQAPGVYMVRIQNTSVNQIFKVVR